MVKHIRVFFAFLTNNYFGKREDIHGRNYRYVYKKFGHAAMVNDYMDGNSWYV